MAKGGRTTTQTTTLDPSSQAHVDNLRGLSQSAAETLLSGGPLIEGADTRSIMEQIAPFMNPFIGQVVEGVRGEFDHLRSGARQSTADAAIRAGALGGSRHGVAEGVRLGELDRAQASQVGGLLSSGFRDALDRGLAFSEYQRALRERQLQEPLFRFLQAQGLLQGGIGPTGSTTATTEPGGSTLGTLGGLGLLGFGLASGNPQAAVAGGSTLFGGGANDPAFTAPLFPTSGPSGIGLSRFVRGR